MQTKPSARSYMDATKIEIHYNLWYNFDELAQVQDVGMVYVYI